MYLAGILGLWALLHVFPWENARSGVPIFRPTLPQAATQEPAKPEQSAQPEQSVQPEPTPQQPDASQGPPQESKPPAVQEEKPKENPSVPAAAPKKKPHAKKAAGKRTSSRKKATPSQDSQKQDSQKSDAPKSDAQKSDSQKQDSQRKVVHRGGTAEPTTQLAPGITDEQAARQRENTNQLMASTDASLAKLSGRQLTQDEQETVSQIRKFMEQVREADKNGDLQRAYKLAVKAHLLSDALEKP